MAERPTEAPRLTPILIIKTNDAALNRIPLSRAPVVATRRRTSRATKKSNSKSPPSLIVVHRVFVWLITMSLTVLVTSLYCNYILVPIESLSQFSVPVNWPKPSARQNSLLPSPRQFSYQARSDYLRAKHRPNRIHHRKRGF